MKTVVLTGVSKGLGLAIAEQLLAVGYRVIGLSRSETPALKALADAHGEKLIYQALDMSDRDAISDVARAILKQYGPVYGLVNNAGIGTDGVLATMHITDIERVLSTNLLGPILMTKYIMRSMLARKEGRIINISSIIASTGFHGLSVYAASKAGLEGFTRSLAREAGKAKVTVNCVAPGYMETDMTAALQGEKLESIKRRAPLGLPLPAEVASAVTYLLSPIAAAITGTVITVDGGSTA
jgi:3-oxoacyl-[acyl-carrier protein] reductase